MIANDTRQEQEPYVMTRAEKIRLLRFGIGAIAASAAVAGLAWLGVEAARTVKGEPTPVLTDKNSELYTVQQNDTAWNLVGDRLSDDVDKRPYVNAVLNSAGGSLERGEQIRVPLDQTPNQASGE